VFTYVAVRTFHLPSEAPFPQALQPVRRLMIPFRSFRLEREPAAADLHRAEPCTF
jgi:hypothetical protein